MSTNLTEAPDRPSDDAKIESWRQYELELAGYSLEDSIKIAERHSGPDRIDLHEAVELVRPSDPERKPCPPDVAADILI